MKKYQISPGQIPHLVRLTADLFHTANKEIAYSPNKGEKATQIHFVADLLKDLVSTAYLTEESKHTGPVKQIITEDDVDKSLYEAFLALVKIGGLPECLVPNFEEWKKEVERMEGRFS